MLNEVSKLLLYSDLGGDSILENLAVAIAAKDSGTDDRDTTIRKIYTEIKRLLDLSTSYGFDTTSSGYYLIRSFRCSQCTEKQKHRRRRS